MENSELLLTKETFCKALRMIREQDAINDEVCKALSKVADCFTFNCNNLWLQALCMVMKEAVNDKYDYIEWWLYEAADDYGVWTSDESKKWCLKAPEALYDFIITECQER